VRKSHRSGRHRCGGRTASCARREHLTEREVAKLIEAAKGNRWGHRDRTMILIAFRHGRAAPAVAAGGLFRSNPGVAPTPQNRSLGFSRRLAGGAKDLQETPMKWALLGLL
jgi:hypothetical protein